MKPSNTSKSFPTSPEEFAAAIAAAPERVDDPDCAYDQNDSGAVEAYWKEGTVRQPGQRGKGKQARKVLLSVRYSPEVVEYFKSTGRGWQRRMDVALQEWMASHRSDRKVRG
jgi:uncharacterized protein (DUF4415 family)